MWEDYGDGVEVVAVGLGPGVTFSVLCFARSRTRETAGINKPIKMAIIAITTSNSMSVKALTQSRIFGRIEAMELLFDFIGNRRGARLAKYPQN